MRLRHPLLQALLRQHEQYGSRFALSDLYAAQWLLDHEQSLRRDQGLAALSPEMQTALVQIALALNSALSTGRTRLTRDELESFAQLKGQEETATLRDALSSSECIAEAFASARAHEIAIIHTDDQLAWARWWRAENALEAQFARLQATPLSELTPRVRAVFQGICGLPDDVGQWASCMSDQHWAIAHALRSAVTLVCGGPGTGKTTTAAGMLRALSVQFVEQENRWPRIALLSPTGKAAARLESSICGQLETAAALAHEDLNALLLQLRGRSMTIHRFLAHEAGSSDFISKQDREARVWRGGKNSHAPVDVVLVDECSMMDLMLAKRLFSCLPSGCRVVLLGDPYQLPPVEPGPVFSQWAFRFGLHQHPLRTQVMLEGWLATKGHEQSKSPQAAPLVVLRKTYRFDGPLKTLADTIREGEVETLFALLQQDAQGLVSWMELSSQSRPIQFLIEQTCEGYRAFFQLAEQGAPVAELAEAFLRFQLLCSTYLGPYGVTALNRHIEGQFRGGQEWYHGKALLIEQNQPELGVYNGDVGFVIAHQNDALHAGPRSDSHWYEVQFPGAGADGDDLVVPLGRLRNWQPAYAMSVHKSQGSEYEQVLCVLAPYAEELLSRALLYTAVTRAKTSCRLIASADSLEQVMKQAFCHL
ncbi:MAG: exodeoxyribonuclease V subunit alpha [Oleiphilaceae bacterium]|nr:exodeoxyribonuclease V subunit alpha [Oleiphilaceae bacterium]